MEYYISKNDSNGYIYSIDNVVLEYIIKYHTDFTSYLHDLVKKHNLETEYWERLNCPYCSKYQFYNNHYHVCNGIYMMVGKYSTKSDISGTWDTYPIVKLEINPNKHAKKPIFNDLLQFLKNNTGDCNLKRYDFCIDIPKKLKDIEVFGSRKEKGLYKGTRYFGQRNKDGYLKIYDKGKEQEIEDDLTRIEYTLVPDKRSHQKDGLNFQNVYILTDKKSDTSLKGTTKAVMKLYSLCMASGIDCENIIAELDRRTRKQIEENINGFMYKQLEIDVTLHDELLNQIKNVFGVVEQKHIIENVDGFLSCPGGFNDLPFE